MASSQKKALWATSGFKSRTTAERKAYRAAAKAKAAALRRTPEAKAEQARLDAYHAAWLAAGMPEREPD